MITRYFFGGAYETTGSAWKKYYSFGGQMVAMRDSSTNDFKYFLTDQLGSVSVVLDANGGILEQQRYLPFGGVRTDIATPPYRITSTDFTYTSQRNLPDTGLMDYKARFYSPTLGRFLQPDSIIPGAARPQTWNRYSYVTNNPIGYTDPTGHRAIEQWGGRNACTDPKYCIRGRSRSPEEIYRGDSEGNRYSYYHPEEHTPQRGGTPPLVNLTLPCGGHMNCNEQPQSPVEYFTSQIPFNQEEVCDYFQLSGMCDGPQISYPLDWFLEDLGDVGLSVLLYMLHAGANITQDLAVVVDMAGAVAEVIFIAVGCATGGPLGCAAGVIASDIVFNASLGNAAETMLSSLSLGFTYFADVLDDGQAGEASTTSLTTWAIGGLSPDPVLDLAIDVYASGYNHGVFCGVNSMLNSTCH